MFCGEKMPRVENNIDFNGRNGKGKSRDTSVEWRVVDNFPKYLVSIDGRVWSSYYAREILGKGDKNGYARVSLTNGTVVKTFKVHRLVLLVFNPIEEHKIKEVNHLDGNKKNNNLWNLEWCTTFENIRHAIDTGLRVSPKSGSKSNKSFLAEGDLDFIYLERMKGRLLKDIASDLAVNWQIVSNVCRGVRYTTEFKNRRESLILKGFTK
jgi:hypothetical protein